jgi:acyl-CoA synthetase (AMP-forming)/AMP-acid ligase II
MTLLATPPLQVQSLNEQVPAQTVPQFIRQRMRRDPAAVAVVDGLTGLEISCGQLDHLIGRCAAGWAAQGLRPGDALLICSPNSIEWVIVALGAMAAGGRVSGANPAYTVPELTHQMRDSGARFAFTLPALLDNVRQAAAAAGCERIVVDGEAEGCLSLATLLATTDAEPAVPQNPGTLALLPYSSGTTGLSKGVMLTHRAIVSNVCQTLHAMEPPEHGVVMLAFLPMFHAMGFALTTLCGLAHGSKLVTLPRFEPQAFLQAIATHRVTDLIAVPPVMQFMAAHPMLDQFDLKSLRIVGAGGAPMSAALEARVSQRLGVPCTQGYGMTEVTAVLTLGFTPATMRPGSVGKLLPAVQMRVVDPATGHDMRYGQEGELWFRGPQLFSGYLNNPQASAATLTSDGWIRTGDLGHVDTDGFVFITDRLKELIKVKGMQVAPAELEALLVTHPAVADAAVIGRPDERAGEVAVAYLVARGALDPDALKSWLSERVAPHKQLADVVLVEAIPKNPSGKLLRRVLRAQDAARMGKPS